MQINISLSVLAILAVFASCQHRVNVSETGLKYQFHEKNENGRKPKIGEILTFHIVVQNSRDSVLFSSYKQGFPAQQLLQNPAFKGSFEEGLTMVAKGDSASFYVNADSLFAKMMQPLPPNIAKGSDVKYTVRILDVQSEEEFQKAQLKKKEEQLKIDAKIINDYLTKSKLNAIKTASGLAYITQKEGTGIKPVAGNIVSVHYVGKLLDGKEFDSSYKNPQSGGKPIDFPIGQNMVIPGWEEGIMTMKKGGKSTFIIPSTLAYGEMGSPGVIPPNSVLIFEVELVDVKKGQ
ncbi:MAG: FKBP-type peptidyl-prolyl cis-trans isomerase [Runella sp.]